MALPIPDFVTNSVNQYNFNFRKGNQPSKTIKMMEGFSGWSDPVEPLNTHELQTEKAHAFATLVASACTMQLGSISNTIYSNISPIPSNGPSTGAVKTFTYMVFAVSGTAGDEGRSTTVKFTIPDYQLPSSYTSDEAFAEDLGDTIRVYGNDDIVKFLG